MLQRRDAAERDEDDARDIGQDRKQARRQHQRGRYFARGHLVVAVRFKLVVVSALPLDAVAHIAGGQYKSYDQHHRVELVALASR